MSNFKYYILILIEIILLVLSAGLTIYLINLNKDYFIFFIFYVVFTFGKLISNITYQEKVRRKFRKL